MKILLIHQNFPGQFLHLATTLAKRGHDVLALTDRANTRATQIKTARYAFEVPPENRNTPPLARTYAEHTARGAAAARACLELKDKHGISPDVVLGHIGWGETLFVKEVWPQARLLAYAEFFYRPRGLDVGFDPELQRDDVWQRVATTARQGHLLLAMNSADAAVAPTNWQARSFPQHLQSKIMVVHDGVDSTVVKPSAAAVFDVPGTGVKLKAGAEVLTFVNRNLEPYRGYHTFIRALPEILQARPQAQVVIVGGDGVSYGTKPPGDKSWKSIFFDEVKDRLDLARIHFVGKLPYPQFLDLMRVSRVHAYLTYPFVLSWSMLEAMSVGALVIGSRTPPVEEVIEDGINGRLVDFFDPRAWSKAIVEALAQPERFAALRQAARQTIVDRYDLHSICLPKMVSFVEDRGEAHP